MAQANRTTAPYARNSIDAARARRTGRSFDSLVYMACSSLITQPRRRQSHPYRSTSGIAVHSYPATVSHEISRHPDLEIMTGAGSIHSNSVLRRESAESFESLHSPLEGVVEKPGPGSERVPLVLHGHRIDLTLSSRRRRRIEGRSPSTRSRCAPALPRYGARARLLGMREECRRGSNAIDE